MISFVYFDLGGVVDLDFSGTNKWEKLKSTLGVKPEQNEEFDKWFDEKEKLLCEGKEKFDLHFGDIKLTLNDFVSRFEVNPSIWPVIDRIRRHCRAGLLTNMYPGMFTAIKKSGILPNISWDINIDSSVVGLQKPDPEIFKLAEERAGVKGDQILFVENTPGHVKIAQTFSWQTFLYDPSHPESSSRNLLAFFSKISI
mgnify:FL=1